MELKLGDELRARPCCGYKFRVAKPKFCLEVHGS